MTEPKNRIPNPDDLPKDDFKLAMEVINGILEGLEASRNIKIQKMEDVKEENTIIRLVVLGKLSIQNMNRKIINLQAELKKYTDKENKSTIIFPGQR